MWRLHLEARRCILPNGLRRVHHFAAVLLLIAASFAAACLVGARDRRTETITGESDGETFCPPRWTADDDPLAPVALEAMERLEADLPEGARPLLPPRAARLSEGCSLRLPISIQRDRCYIFGIQVTPPEGLRPWALLRIPDPSVDSPREHVVDHPMETTFGLGADPICYDDTFASVVEVRATGESALIWVQAYEVSHQAAEQWVIGRRAQLAESAAAAQVAALAAEQERAAARERCRPSANTPSSDGGSSDGGLSEGGLLDAGAVDGGRGGDDPICPEVFDAGSNDSGDEPIPGWPDGSLGGADVPRCEAGVGDCAIEASPLSEPPSALSEPPSALSEPPSATGTPNVDVPLGPLAVELVEQCRDGDDNDGDGTIDCSDPDCLSVCSRSRVGRAPWPRVIELRLGGAYRVASSDVVAQESLDPDYDPLQMRWALSTHASGVWRANRYLGVGLDLGVGYLELRSYLLGGGRGAQNHVSVLSVSLGASLQVSVPIWIMEIGGSVGVGWLRLSASGEERMLSGDDTSWQDNPGADQSFSHPYGSGRLWVDFWVTEYIALGLYGGVLAPMTRRLQLVANDYHVGIRTTIRLGF